MREKEGQAGGEESPGELLTHRSEQQPGFSEQGVAQPSFLAEPGCMSQL